MADRDRDQLKPCPFCGGKARLVISHEFGHYIGCLRCKCSTRHMNSRSKVKARWNRRAEAKRDG